MDHPKQAAVSIVDITDHEGTLRAPDWLRPSESVHRQLRPQLPQNYVAKMHSVFRRGGAMCVALRSDQVVGVAVYRILENTCYGLHMYVDDLITDEKERSSGVGNALMAHPQKIARDTRCAHYTLDSGTWRQQAHKFYFREGMTITSFHFDKKLQPQ